MEMVLKAMEEENVVNANNLDDYLRDFWEGDDDMDVNTLSSIESNDPIDDLDLSFGEEETFDLMGTTLPLTVVYGEYVLTDLQSNMDFNVLHLQIAHLSDIESINHFRF
jgi:hypothetical protein